MRKANVPGQKSVVSRLYGKFAPADEPDASGLSNDQKRLAEADRGKQIEKRDGVTARAYAENRPGDVSYQPNYGTDDRDMIIKEAEKVLRSSLENKIGKGGINVESADKGFKVQAAVPSKVSANSKTIKRARAVFRVEFKTPMPNKTRIAYASVEYTADNSKGDQYKVAEHLIDSDDVNKKIAMMSDDISEFINSDAKRFHGSDELKRMASRQENLGDNPYDGQRKLVIRDWKNPDITAYKRIAVRDVENSVGTLKANGIEVQKRVFDDSHGIPEATGPVYEVVAASSQYKNIDSMLRKAGEFTTPSRELKNDEAPNKSRGEVFKNQEQHDDPSKFPGRSSEKEEPSYKNADPKDWAEDSEGKAFDADLYDKPKEWPGRSDEKNEEDVKGKLPRPKPHSDEKPNREGVNPNMPGPGTSDKRDDWPNRSLDAGGTLGVGEMMKYDRYKHQRTKQAQASPLGTYSMETPLGSAGQGAPMGGGADEIGSLMDQEDVGIVQDEGGQVVLVVPRDKLIDLAGEVTGGEAPPAATPAPPPGGMTTPEDQGLPGAQAQRKQAEGGGKVPMPQGPAKVQEKPEIPHDYDSMDGMSHSKSADEGNTPKIKPSEEYRKNPPKARMAAIRLKFPQASSCFATAQRLAVKAAEAANGGEVLDQKQFADATRIAQYMIGKAKGEDDNKYTVTLAHLPIKEPLVKFMRESMQRVAVPGGSGGSPNAQPPKSKGREDSMDGLDHGKSDAGDNLSGFRSGDEEEAKANEAGGINKNPEDPNTSKDDDSMDGLDHGKSSGGEPKVTPSSDYKGSNPVKPMKAQGKHNDFREELLDHLTGAGPTKNPHRVFASVKKQINNTYDRERADVMNRFARFEISDVAVGKELEQLDVLKEKRLSVVGEARTAIFKKAKRAKKKVAKDGKPDAHFNMPDVKNNYNHQAEEWWDRTLEKQQVPAGAVEDMGLKEDESKAYDEELYDQSSSFVGRTDEKPGGIEGKDLHKLREDEDKAFNHGDMYDSPDNWVGRAADKGWAAPTSNSYMLKTEKRQKVEASISEAINTKTGEYKAPEFSTEIGNKMLELGGLLSKKEGSSEAIVETGKNDRRQFCYGTRRIAVMRDIVDLHARGLNAHEITYRYAQSEPDMLVNVQDVIDGYRTAKALVKKSAKKPEGPSKKKSIEASIEKKLSKKMAAKEVTDSELKKVLELGGLDQNGERDDDFRGNGPLVDSGRFYFGTCDPDKIRDVINAHKKGCTVHEIEYYTQGKYNEGVWSYDIKEIIAAYKSKKKKGEKKSEAAGSKDYNKRSYDNDRKDDIASDMPEQKSWQKGEVSEVDPKSGRSDQPGDLDKDQKPQPTISSQEKDNQDETKGYDWKKESAANPFAVCTDSVGRENKAKYEDCVQDVKKKNKDEGVEEVPDTPKKKEKKKGQVNEDVLPKEHRDQGIEQQFGMVTKRLQPGNNVSYAGNDTVYDNTGRFPKADPKSPYTVAHIAEQVLIGLDKRVWDTAQDALDGVAAGERFGRLSQGQLNLLTKTLTAHGFKLDEPKAREYDRPQALEK